MRSLRRNLRQLAIAWIVVQAVSVSALAGFDCCAAHQPVKRNLPPAQTAEGSPCPMHAASRPPVPEKCVMRGTCKGPMAALLVLLSNNGIPSESPVAGPDFHAGPSPNPPVDTFIVHFESPDPPPPRV